MKKSLDEKEVWMEKLVWTGKLDWIENSVRESLREVVERLSKEVGRKQTESELTNPLKLSKPYKREEPSKLDKSTN